MGRALIIFILICFAASFVSNSYAKTMLSLENGLVYTEEFDLNHILTAACATQAGNEAHRQSHFGFGQTPCHRHVQLTSYYIPEFDDAAAVVKQSPPATDFLPYVQIILSTPFSEAYKCRFDLGGRLKLPNPSLQQSSVLLI